MNDKYGLRIYNYDAASIFYFNNGIKDKYKKKGALFANSLFSDFLKANGLKRYRLKENKDGGESKWIKANDGAWTRDIVCVDFSSGVKTYKQEIKSLEKKKKDNSENAAFFDELMKAVEKNKDKYTQEKKIDTLRKEFYDNGFSIKYHDKEISYKMLYRSAGKAKKGSCMFICEGLYKKALNYLRMGNPKMLKGKKHMVEREAYKSLVASAIVGKVKINPQNILVIDDVEVSFKRNVVAVTDLISKYHLSKVSGDPVEDKMINALFDGQSLIDRSVFFSSDLGGKKPNGFILLRQHFFKSAAFCADIKQFFEDYCSERKIDYENFIVKDRWGNEHFAKDIELITTENSMKWKKFVDGRENEREIFDFWRNQVSKDDNLFGIVKTAHESKLGNYQRMSYQMVNSLENDKSLMDSVVKCSVDYLTKLKKSDDEFLVDKTKDVTDNEFIKYLDMSKSFFNDYEVLVELCKQNRFFLQCRYFRDRKKSILSEYTKKLRGGKILQNAENLVIVGSPYAMLLKAAGEDVYKDTMFEVEGGDTPAVQCYTKRFPDGAELAEFRSPYNGRNNLGFMRNKYPSERIERYFSDFGEQIVAVNMIETDFQARNNGSDQDSDFIYTTDEPSIVACAKKYYKEYPTIINNISSRQDANKTDCADIDSTLASAAREIGEASNYAQLCMIYSYNFPERKQEFEDYVCILSVLAQIAIDKAKRNFGFDSEDALRAIKEKINAKENGYPEFWEVVLNKSKNKKRKTDENVEAEEVEDFEESEENKDAEEYKEFEENKTEKLECPMNYVYKTEFYDGKEKTRDIRDIDEFFKKGDVSGRATKKDVDMEKKISELGCKVLKIKASDSGDDDGEGEWDFLSSEFDDLLQEIKKYSKKRASFAKLLIDRAFCITPGQMRNKNGGKKATAKNKSFLLKMLYNINKDAVLSCFKREEDM